MMTGSTVEWTDGIARLRSMYRRSRIDPKRWLVLVDNADRFVSQWGAQAAQMGWTTADIFGCHPEVPEIRFDFQGLVWFLPDAALLALTPHEASPRFKNGTVNTFRRMPPSPGHGVMIWDLDADKSTHDAPCGAPEGAEKRISASDPGLQGPVPGTKGR